jgi:hypothetical protein
VAQSSDDCREAALRALPAAYEQALRLRAAGVADTVICRALQVEPEGLVTLLEVAELKLAALLQRAGLP